MRRYGLYDMTRGLTTALAAALAGLLLWTATQVGQQTTPRFWAEMGIVAGAGLVIALSQVLGGWTKGLQLRLSPGTFLLGFVPVLVCVGWILMAVGFAGLLLSMLWWERWGPGYFGWHRGYPAEGPYPPAGRRSGYPRRRTVVEEEEPGPPPGPPPM